MRAVSPRATTLQATTTGTVEGSMVKMDPNRICWVAPLMAWVVVSRYRKRAAHPVAAPSTMPVATSRPRTRCTPMASMLSAPRMPPARKPVRGLSPSSNAPEPPAVETSARECPAKDWPRMTVKIPTAAETTATTPPMTTAVCTGALEKNPGSKSHPMPLSALLARGPLG